VILAKSAKEPRLRHFAQRICSERNLFVPHGLQQNSAIHAVSQNRADDPAGFVDVGKISLRILLKVEDSRRTGA